jgi:hypothetical protein
MLKLNNSKKGELPAFVISMIIVVLILVIAVPLYGKFSNPLRSETNSAISVASCKVVGFQFSIPAKQKCNILDNESFSVSSLDNIENFYNNINLGIALLEDNTRRYTIMKCLMTGKTYASFEDFKKENFIYFEKYTSPYYIKLEDPDDKENAINYALVCIA